jgi:predicted transcriptional regulator
MLSVRLPESLENRLADYCDTMQVSKSFAVQTALEKHLKASARVTKLKPIAKKNPFLALVGTGNGQFNTEQIMRMTRGEDWNKA